MNQSECAEKTLQRWSAFVDHFIFLLFSEKSIAENIKGLSTTFVVAVRNRNPTCSVQNNAQGKDLQSKDMNMAPVEKIADWVSNKPVWWRHAVRLALADGRLTEARFDEIWDVARMEHGLTERSESFETWEQPVDVIGFTSEQSEVSLTSISAVKGVNALAEGQHLAFPPHGLVIVYGDNGSGKSSYTNILKNACLTRGERPPIRGNVFSAENAAPEATLTIFSRGSMEQFVWTPETMSEAGLKSVRVFDSSSAAHYVNKEDTLSFNPAGLHLLTDLAAVVTHIRNIVEEECQPGNGFQVLSLPETSGPVSRYLHSLNETSDEATLQGFAATEAESAQIEPLMREIAHHRLGTPESIRQSLKQRELVLAPLADHMEKALAALGDAAVGQMRLLSDDCAVKQELVENLKKTAFADMPYSTLGNQAWIQLWKSARAFVAQEKADAVFPMRSGDCCPLCQQEVTDGSADRLAMLDRYLADQASRDAQTSLEKYAAAAEHLKKMNLNLGSYQASLNELETTNPGSEERIVKLFATLEARRNLLTRDKVPASLPELDYEAAGLLTKQRDALKIQVENLATNADLSALIHARELELENVQERHFVKQHLDILTGNLKRHKILHKFRCLQAECATQSISRLSSQINQADVVDPLIQAFQSELKALGFNRFTVKIESRNRGGHQQFKLVIEDSGEPAVAKVASEGEQRCIALASFFAEMRADGRKSSVVFDDPVNSLSHQWRAVIARRLVEESTQRQVIVFTHDLVFYKWLIEESELRKTEHFELSLDRSRGTAGFVRNTPPWDALSTGKRIRKLKADLVQLRKGEQTLMQTDFLRVAGIFYSELRETWERLVEPPR